MHGGSRAIKLITTLPSSVAGSVSELMETNSALRMCSNLFFEYAFSPD